VGQRHLKLKLRQEGCLLDAMLFFHDEQLPSAIRAAYQLGVNEYNGVQSVQLTLRHWNPA
jgi:single-stranded-DNA-specific exonuclease